MKHRRGLSATSAALLALATLSVSPLVGQGQAKLSFKDVYGGASRSFSTRLTDAWRFNQDGTVLINRDGKALNPLTLDPTEMPPRSTDDRPSINGLFEDALKAAGMETSARELQGRRVRSTLPRAPQPNPGMRATPDGNAAAVVLNEELWVYRRNGSARRVRQNVKSMRRFEISPSGDAVSGIVDNNLVMINLKDGALHQLSDDGSEDLFYGELDWVYQEEVYGRGNFKATWWSEAGDHMAYMRIDESGVDTFTVVDHIPDQLKTELLKYPKSGSMNPRASLYVADAETGATKAVDLSKYKAEDEILIVRVGWTPDSGAVLFMVQNREQTWLDLNAANPKTGEMFTLIHETSDSWVNRPNPPRWLKNGTFLWESERTGFNHLYHYKPSGELIGAVTSGGWQVKRIIRLDEENGVLFFYGTKDGSAQSNAYRCNLDGSNFVRITRDRGSHRVTLDAKGHFMLDTFSSLERVPEQRLCDARNGEIIKVLVSASRPKAEKTFGISVPQLVRIPCRDGFEIDATIQRPVPFDESKSYPVWIETYSGPAAPSVRDSWGLNPWQQFLCHQGIIVFQVNVRSAADSGQVNTATCYKQFTVQELEDMDDAVDWLCKNKWADADRVGITGWSYGGTMAAFALTHSKKYKLGFAGAGVYDWRLYDTIYTERYMAKPQNNKEGYDRSSVVKGAKNLHGHLVLVHGSMDDNVHMQNTLQLAYALQKAGKPFEMMIYPRSRHGVREPGPYMHLQRLKWNSIQEHLLN